MNKIIDKIQKLKAKADGTTNEHEAELFMNKVHALMMEHNLHQADLRHVKDNDILKHQVEAKYGDPWRRFIMSSCAQLFMCQVVTTRHPTHFVFSFVGTRVNATIAADMADYLIKTTLMLAKEYSKVRRERLGFERGCGTRLAQRVTDKYYDSKKHDPVNPNNLPALYETEEERVAEKLPTLFANLKTGRKTKQKLNVHSAIGAASANNVPIRDKGELT